MPVGWELRLLKRSIKKWGLLEPLLIDQNGVIIDGRP
jgi:ParB-like chromosome segregation protein Spo0J